MQMKKSEWKRKRMEKRTNKQTKSKQHVHNKLFFHLHSDQYKKNEIGAFVAEYSVLYASVSRSLHLSLFFYTCIYKYKVYIIGVWCVCVFVLLFFSYVSSKLANHTEHESISREHLLNAQHRNRIKHPTSKRFMNPITTHTPRRCQTSPSKRNETVCMSDTLYSVFSHSKCSKAMRC